MTRKVDKAYSAMTRAILQAKPEKKGSGSPISECRQLGRNELIRLSHDNHGKGHVIIHQGTLDKAKREREKREKPNTSSDDPNTNSDVSVSLGDLDTLKRSPDSIRRKLQEAMTYLRYRDAWKLQMDDKPDEALQAFIESANSVMPGGNLPYRIGDCIAKLSDPAKAQEIIKSTAASANSKASEIFHIRKSNGPIDKETHDALKASVDLSLQVCQNAVSAMNALLQLEAFGCVKQQEILRMYKGQYYEPKPELASNLIANLIEKRRILNPGILKAAVDLNETLPTGYWNRRLRPTG